MEKAARVLWKVGVSHIVPVAIFFLGATLAYLSKPESGFSEWERSLLLSVGTGFLASALMILLYNQAVEIRAEKERKARLKRAITPLTSTMKQHSRALIELYRGATDKNEPPKHKRFSDFLLDDLPETVPSLDLTASSPYNSQGSIPFSKYISNNFKRLDSTLDDIVKSSGQDINIELYIKIHDLKQSQFMQIAKMTEEVMGLNIKEMTGLNMHIPQNFFQNNAEQIRDYCKTYSSLIKEIDKQMKSNLNKYEKSMWKNDHFEFGHARFTG